MGVSDTQLVENLKDALARNESERDAALEAVRKRFQEREESLQRTIAMLTGDPIFAHTNGDLDQAPATVSSLAVGEDKLDAVRTVLRKKTPVRQADITHATGLNSGTVSVALRRLQLNGEAKPGPKIDGSRTWDAVKIVARRQSPAVA